MTETAPTGNVTLVFTDIEGSTLLWEALGDAFISVLALHNRIMRATLAGHHGYEVKTEGDSFMIAFSTARDGVLFCLDVQGQLHDADWPACLNDPALSHLAGTHDHNAFRGLRIRMGVHTGTPICETDPTTGREDYFGLDVNRAARLAQAAHGGQLLISDATWGALDPLDLVVMEDLGEHALRGLEAREHVRQLLPPTLAERRFPRLKTPELRKTNLPTRMDSFIGRSGALADLADRIEQGQRLITILGPGGTGKTRLSQRFAAEQLADFPGGAWFCDLTEARSLEGFTNAVGQGIGVPIASEDALGQLGNALDQRGRVLVVLDNFEQVADVAAATIGRWIFRAPELHFVVTSRTPLRLKGEHLLTLSPHAPSEALQLFEERAVMARPGFAVTDANRAVVQQIVDRLDGLALAVELAAARIRLMKPEQILLRLDQRFQFLRSRRRDQSARQTTLRGAIDWSWDLLDACERRALAQCSVFRGGFTIEAAEAVLELGEHADPTLDLIQALLDHSLIRTQESSDGSLRLGLFESIQAYAAEKLQAATETEQVALPLRHARYYAQWGQQTHLDALYAHGGVARYRVLVRELENLLDGVQAAQAHNEGEIAALCALAAATVYQRVGPAHDGLAVLNQVLERCALEPDMEAHLRWRTAQALRRLGRPKEALTQVERALQLFIDLRDPRNAARVEGTLAILYGQMEQHDQARTHYQAALAGHQQTGDRRFEGQVLSNLANVVREGGESGLAVEHFEAALRIHRSVGNRVFEGSALGNLGCLKQAQGLFIAAREHFEAALEIHREVGNRLFQGIELGNLGSLLYDQGEHGAAEEALTESVEILDELWPVEAAENRSKLALLRARDGQLTEAMALLEQAEARLRPDHPRKLTRLLCRKGLIAQQSGDRPTATQALAEASAIAAGTDMPILPMLEALKASLDEAS